MSRPRGDAGASLVDLLVGLALAVMVISIGVGIMQSTSKTDRHVFGTAQVANEHQDAQATLSRDVMDGESLRIADARELALVVYRDGTCRVRHYWVDDAADPGPALMLSEEFYETDRCVGDPEIRTNKLVSRVQETGPIFSYEDTRQWDLGSPIDYFPEVRMISWHIDSPVDTKGGELHTTISGASFRHTHEHLGTGVEQRRALAPYLQLVTPTPGVDRPQLTWTDNSPELTVRWAVWRTIHLPGHPDHEQATIIGHTFPEVTHWEDTTLPAGATGTYHVQAALVDGGLAPHSNVVQGGLRPDAPTVTVTGQPTSIRVDWAAVPGATTYDIYRDGSLIANLGDVTTFTDNVGYGHAHNYQVVASNIWERRWTAYSDNGRVPVGTAASKAFPGGQTRNLSTARGAFTAPAAPSITATPTTSASVTVGRTYAGWTGAGPTAGRDRGWELEHRLSGGSWARLGGEHVGTPYTHTGRTGGQTDFYRARACNSSGCGPWSGNASALQRPAAPTCTVDQPTTRSLRVTINRAPSASSYTAYDIVSNRAGGTNLGVGTAYQRTINQLTHNLAHTFTVRTRNASPAGGGWSDTRTCSGTTTRLTASLGTITTTTRGVTIRGANANNGLRHNGSSAELRVQRQQNVLASWTGVNADRTYNKLAHNTNHGIYLKTTDGHNSVEVYQQVRTEKLSISLAPLVRTTRAVTIVGRNNNGTQWSGGNSRLLTVETMGGTVLKSWTGLASDRTYDKLTHGTQYRVRATNSDGFNTVEAVRTPTTRTLSVGAASCTATVQTAHAPGSIRVSGGHQVRLSSGSATHSGPRTYTGLSAGTYRAQARNTNTDGHNTVHSSWNNCPARTITTGIPDRPLITYLSRGQSLVARWSAPTGANRYQYRFDQWTAQTGGWTQGTVHTTTGTQALSTFNPGSERYRFAIRARGAAGWSSWRTEEFPW